MKASQKRRIDPDESDRKKSRICAAFPSSSGASLPGDALNALADYAARFNLAYFSGAYHDTDRAWRDDPAYSLWQAYGGGVFGQYLNLVMDEPNGENLSLVLEQP